MRISKQQSHLVIGIIAVIVAAAIPLFIKSPYYLDLFLKTIVYGIMAMTFVLTLRAGLINLGTCAFVGFGAYFSAAIAINLHVSVWLCILITFIVTGILAFGIGYILIGSGSTGFTFVILSSVIGMLFSVAAGNMEFLGGYNGLPDIPPPNPITIPFLPAIVFDNKVPFYYLGLFLLIIIILILKTFYASRIGRAWDAVALNSRLAESVGVNLFKYKMLSFIIASAICGLIGSFYAHYNNFIHPSTFGMWQNIYLQLYAILGGISYATAGPLVGSLVMICIPELLRVANVIAPIVTGILLIVLILFFPSGLLGLFDLRVVIYEKTRFFLGRLWSSLAIRKVYKK
jgi:branched-chain amino acid transport system permease protein